MGNDWHVEWTAALDALELDVAAVEARLAGDHATRELPVSDPWQPPTGLGPLPLDLRPRADAILTRQLAAGEALARAMAMNRQQAALLNRMHTTQQRASRPAYVDCAM